MINTVLVHDSASLPAARMRPGGGGGGEGSTSSAAFSGFCMAKTSSAAAETSYTTAHCGTPSHARPDSAHTALSQKLQGASQSKCASSQQVMLAAVIPAHCSLYPELVARNPLLLSKDAHAECLASVNSLQVDLSRSATAFRKISQNESVSWLCCEACTRAETE